MNKLAHVIKSLQLTPIRDEIVRSTDLRFLARNQTLCVGIPVVHPEKAAKTLPLVQELSLHKHAFGQLCNRFNIPASYANSLLRKSKDWATNLLVRNFTELAANQLPVPYMLRSVNGQLRGFLSASYKRLDTVHLIEEFSACAQACGAEPFDAYQTELRTIVQAAYKGEVKVGGTKIRIGVLFQNSEFGAGCAAVKMFITSFGRSLVGAGIQRRHRGSRNAVHDDANLKKDSEAVAKDMQQTVLRYLATDNLDAVLAEIELSASLVIDIKTIEDTLQKLTLNLDEMKLAVDLFKDESAKLPQGQTMFRLANTVAWLAENEPDGDRKVDLMQAAGSLIFKEPK